METPNPKFVPCERKIEEFIKFDSEVNIKNYFMKDIDKLLEEYKPGDPSMKPDVIKQTKEIEEEREKMRKQMAANGQIMLQVPGQPPRALSTQEIVKLLENQKKELETRGNRIKQLEQAAQSNQPFPLFQTPSPPAPPQTTPSNQPFPLFQTPSPPAPAPTPQTSQINIEVNGQPPRPMTNAEIMQLINNLKKEVDNRNGQIKQLQESVSQKDQTIQELMQKIASLEKEK